MAYNFNSGNNRILFNSATYLNNLSVVSISIIFSADSYSTGTFPRLWDKGNFLCALNNADTSLSVSIPYSTTTQALRNSGPSTGIQFYHFGLISNGGLIAGTDVRTFVENVENYVFLQNGVGTRLTETNPDWKLGNNDGNTRGLDGRLAEFAIWNVELTEGEMKSLSKGFSPCRVRPQSLLLYSRMIRDTRDLMRRLGSTITGATVAVHPRVY